MVRITSATIIISPVSLSLPVYINTMVPVIIAAIILQVMVLDIDLV